MVAACDAAEAATPHEGEACKSSTSHSILASETLGVSPDIRLAKLQEGDFEDDYEMTSEVIARDLSGPIRLAVHRLSGEKVAVKTYNWSTMTRTRKLELERELSVQTAVSHPNVAEIKAVYQSKTTVRVILELLPGEDLHTCLEESGELSESAAAQVVEQLLSALRHLHGLGYAHCDVKATNLLYVQGGSAESAVKLNGFGLARPCVEALRRVCWNNKDSKACAPEVAHRGAYDCKADIWSVGILTHYLLTRQDVSIRRNYSPGLSLGFYYKLSANAQDFIQALLTMDADRRPDASAMLAHPWIVSQKGPAAPPSPSSLFGALKAVSSAMRCRSLSCPKLIGQAKAPQADSGESSRGSRKGSASLLNTHVKKVTSVARSAVGRSSSQVIPI